MKEAAPGTGAGPSPQKFSKNNDARVDIANDSERNILDLTGLPDEERGVIGAFA